MKTLFATLILAAVSFGQTAVNVKSLTLSSDAAAAVQAWMVTQVTDTPTGLNGKIDDVVTAIVVADGSAIKANDVIVVDEEALQVTAKTGKNLTVARGTFGTKAVAHNNNAMVFVMRYRTMALLFQQHIVNMVGQIMDTTGYPTKATQDAVISTAQAAKDAAKVAAVQ
jgi:hypothetical protein